MDEDFEKKAEQSFKLARNFEKERQFQDAIQNYEDAKNSYLKTEDQKSFSLECILNIAINKIKLESWQPSKPGYQAYYKIIEKMEDDVEEIREEIFQGEKPDLEFQEMRILIYRILENHLREVGMEEEAWIMCNKYLDLQTEVKKIERKSISIFRYPKAKILLWLEAFALRTVSIFFDYGLNIGKILGATLLVWIILGILFSVLTCIHTKLFSNNEFYNDYIGFIWQHVDKEPANFIQCLYFSIVTLTSLGTEEFYPVGFTCKTLQSLEVIIGYVILGLVLAHFSRRIR